MSARRPRASLPSAALAATLAGLLVAAGCRTTRVMDVTSDPPGALVRLDEEVIGRTPLEHEFLHYGRRRLTMYLPGYLTWSRRIEPEPRWYSRFPLDFVTEVLVPLGLTHRFEYDAVLIEDTGVDESGSAPVVEGFVERAVEVRGRRLEKEGEAGDDEVPAPDPAAPQEPPAPGEGEE